LLWEEIGIKGEDIMTVNQVVETFPAFAEPTIRWWIFNAEENGFGVCLIRVGGRVFIDRVAFEDWLESQRVEALSNPGKAFDEYE
jgi:hypothetical protein